MKSLIVKINKECIHPLENSIDRPVVQIQEAKRAAVTGFAFHVRNMEHVRQIHNVRIQMRTVDAICDIAR
jgi:hypothetical protein